MGMRRKQTKEQFIKSRQDARATEAKAAEAKRIQDEALARRNANRARLDLYRNKFRQQPTQPGMASNPIGSIKPNLPQPMAKNAIGSAVGNQLIGGSDKPIVQPGLQDGGLLYNDNVRSLDDVASGMVPQMSSTPTMMREVPFTQQKQETTPGLEIFQKKLSDRELKNTFMPENDSGVPYSPEFGGMSGSGKDQSKADIPFRPEFGGMGGSGESVAQNQSIPTTSPDKKQDKAGDTMGALKSLADAIKPKEELPVTQYRSFTVDDTSAPVKDVMSARREALMKIMGGK